MPVTLEWLDDDHRIILANCVGTWSWYEALEITEQVNEMVEGVDHPVDRIVYLKDAPWIPPDYVVKTKELMEKVDPDLGMLIFVAQSIVWEAFDFTCRQYNINVEHLHVDTLEEALDKIRKRRNGA